MRLPTHAVAGDDTPTDVLSIRETDGAVRTRGHPRSLVPVALLGGAVAAAATLAVCLAVGLVGWFVTDAGTHGVPRDALRTGALAWLTAHGSGVSIGDVPVTLVPLGITAACSWACWRLGHRVGEMLSGHGPDAARLSDGERDWTVPVATGTFTAGYLLVAVGTLRMAEAAAAGAVPGRLVAWTVTLGLLVAGPAIAVGSGRAAIWASLVPRAVVAAAAGALRVLVGLLAVSVATLATALAMDLGSAANMFSRLHTDVGEGVVFAVLALMLVPNATAFAGSYLLGPGFVVGTQTLVSPGLVVLGPLPLFPLFAALPEEGTPMPWVAGLMALPPLAAAFAVARNQRRFPTRSYADGALRGCAAGILAGAGFAVLSVLAGGAAGPGRMRTLAPLADQVLVHGVLALGLGGLVGGLVATWWQRRTPAAEPVAG